MRLGAVLQPQEVPGQTAEVAKKVLTLPRSEGVTSSELPHPEVEAKPTDDSSRGQAQTVEHGQTTEVVVDGRSSG